MPANQINGINTSPIVACASWADAQALAAAGHTGVIRLPSGQLVRVCLELVSSGWAVEDTLCPAELTAPGTPWVLRSKIDQSTDPDSLPAGWTWSTTGGSLTGGLGTDLVAAANTSRASYLYYTAGVSGSVRKFYVVTKVLGVVVGTATGDATVRSYLSGKYLRYCMSLNGYRGFRSTIVTYPDILPALAVKKTHWMLQKVPTTAEDASIMQIPDQNVAAVDSRGDGLGAWTTDPNDDLVLFTMNSHTGTSTITLQNCAIWTVSA